MKKKNVYGTLAKWKLRIYNFPYNMMEIVSRKRIDFNRGISIEEYKKMGFDEKIVNAYGMANPAVKKVLKMLDIKETDSILDMGCGKGKAMHYMTHFPFKKIDGVDISSEIIEVAKNNFNILKLEGCEFYCCNAAEFSELDVYNFFFFFNPFPREVMNCVIANIKESYQNNFRRIILIYENPVDSDLFDAQKWLKKIYDLKYDICPRGIKVYETVPISTD